MSAPGRMYVLLHGTTRARADRIKLAGPDPFFREPGSNTRPDSAFWTVDADTPPEKLHDLGTPEHYARLKAVSSGEGDPVILEMHVPEWIVQCVLAHWSGRLNYPSGAVVFDFGCGLEELLEEWKNLSVSIRSV